MDGIFSQRHGIVFYDVTEIDFHDVTQISFFDVKYFFTASRICFQDVTEKKITTLRKKKYEVTQKYDVMDIC